MEKLFGHVNHKIDAKYRVRIPKEYRSALGDKLFFVVRPERCIGVFTEEKCGELIAMLSEIKTNDERYAFARFVVSSIVEVHEDDQKRILIPNFYREYAGLTAECDVVTAGCIDHVEISLLEEKGEKIDYGSIKEGFGSMAL